MSSSLSRTAEIRAVARTDQGAARTLLEHLISDLFNIPVVGLEINHDQYSLNSLNGFCRTGAQDYFFKFHQEEGEDLMRGEYYRAEILARAGLPVDHPVHVSSLPGEQLLIYRRRSDPRFSEVLLELDFTGDPHAIARAAAAEARLNDQLLACAKASLHPITPTDSAAEPIHRLFHERLIDQPSGQYPGGRFARFYVGRRFEFPSGVSLHWDDLCAAVPVINGSEHARSVGEMFDLAHMLCAPEALATAGGIIAHGDAHNANVWYRRGNPDSLSLFDPAFAGDKVPSLLAEVKSTFHNIFAHPFWLYDPKIAAERFTASVRLKAGRLFIDTDWQLSLARKALLRVKARHFWRPWLAHLSERGMLPANWEAIIRTGLFLCPTLVMNLNAGEGGDKHNPTSSAIGLGIALAAGSPPLAGSDIFTEFFDEVRP